MALNIKTAIAMRGLTATQVAKRMGISTSTLSAMINENPTLSSLERIAEALRCDVAELFDRPVAWKPTPNPSQREGKPTPNPSQREGLK
jgi:transcriptional regulator with XRE-family HTH domain